MDAKLKKEIEKKLINYLATLRVELRSVGKYGCNEIVNKIKEDTFKEINEVEELLKQINNN